MDRPVTGFPAKAAHRLMPTAAPLTADQLLAMLRDVHTYVGAAVLAACEASPFEQLCGEAVPAAGDTVYAIDRIAEQALLECITGLIASREPVVLIGEGVDGGVVTVPKGASHEDARWRLIVDPIDGTRGLMFQKRSAWILTGVAPNHGRKTMLSDVLLAIQTEIPLAKQHLFDRYWAVKGACARGERRNRLTGEVTPLVPRPSNAATLAHGYGTICSFFTGGRDLLGKIADELSRELLFGSLPGEARIFDDQYVSTGGQIAGLMSGQDRFVADLRPLLLKSLQARGDVLGHCCHPYDICTQLIASEAGVAIAMPSGCALDVPLDTETDVTWVGYANEPLRTLIEPVLQRVLKRLKIDF